SVINIFERREHIRNDLGRDQTRLSHPFEELFERGQVHRHAGNRGPQRFTWEPVRQKPIHLTVGGFIEAAKRIVIQEQIVLEEPQTVDMISNGWLSQPRLPQPVLKTL